MLRLTALTACLRRQTLAAFKYVLVIGVANHFGVMSLAQESKAVASPRAQAAEQQIRSALQRPVSWNFRETPLKKVAEVLSGHFGFSVRIDEKGLKDAAVSEEMPVNLQLQNVSCETALNAALHSYNLDWFVEGETVVITTQDAANCYLVTRVYPVLDLVKSRSKHDRTNDADSLINIITSTVAAPTWSQVGGQGSADYFASAGTLLISQTRDVHDQIGKLLAVLRQARDEQGLRPRGPASGFKAVGHVLQTSPASTRQYAAVQDWNQSRVHQ
jgi:hypothetical protein